MDVRRKSEHRGTESAEEVGTGGGGTEKKEGESVPSATGLKPLSYTGSTRRGIQVQRLSAAPLRGMKIVPGGSMANFFE